MLGLALSVLAALLFGVSTVMQKYCLRGMHTLSVKAMFRNSVWIMSVLVGIIGIQFYLVALIYSPISVVQPLLAISIVTPVMFGWLAFGEQMRSRWIHIIFIVLGVLLVSL